MCIVNFVIILSSIIITKMFNNTKSNLSENKKFSRIMRDPRRNFTYFNVDNDDDVIVVPPFPPKPTPHMFHLGLGHKYPQQKSLIVMIMLQLLAIIVDNIY